MASASLISSSLSEDSVSSVQLVEGLVAEWMRSEDAGDAAEVEAACLRAACRKDRNS